MNLVEVFVPKGALTAEQKDRLGERLVTGLIAAPGAPSDLIDRARALCWLVFHEPEVWTVGGRRVEAGQPPRYVIRLSVPGGHITDEMRAEMVARITRSLAESDEDPDRLYQEPDAWVHIVELPDGNLGAFGHVLGTEDVTHLVVTGSRLVRPDPRGDQQHTTVIDPICGMTVVLADGAITLESDGTTHGFCSTACRGTFAAGTR